jgi:hypothetical protein
MILVKLMTGKNKEEQTHPERAAESHLHAISFSFSLISSCLCSTSIYLVIEKREKRVSERKSEKPLDVDGGDCRMKKIEMGIEGREIDRCT